MPTKQRQAQSLRRPGQHLTGAHIAALNSYGREQGVDDLGTVLARQFADHRAAIEARSGHRGTFELAAQTAQEPGGLVKPGLLLGENRIAGVADPVRDLDAVNLQTMRRLLKRSDDRTDALFEDPPVVEPPADATATSLAAFWGVTVFATLTTTTTNPAASPANLVHLYRFTLPFDFTTSVLTFETVSTRAAAKVGVGLYDADGLLLLQSGAISGATPGYHHPTFASVSLPHGDYYFGQTTDDILLTCRMFAFDTNFENLLNSNGIKWGTAAEAPVSPGVLPGVIAPANITANINNRPIVATMFEP